MNSKVSKKSTTLSELTKMLVRPGFRQTHPIQGLVAFFWKAFHCFFRNTWGQHLLITLQESK